MPAPGSALSATVKAIGDASGEKILGERGIFGSRLQRPAPGFARNRVI
jgi:hypothetical protein